MKILMVNDHRPEEVLGGTERYILDVTAGLEKRSHEVHLFAMSDTGSETRPTRRVFHFRPARSLAGSFSRRTLFYPALYRALRAYVREVQPDVVHLHNNYRCVIIVNCHGERLAVPEEVAFLNGWISRAELETLGRALGPGNYVQYLLRLACG